VGFKEVVRVDGRLLALSWGKKLIIWKVNLNVAKIFAWIRSVIPAKAGIQK
jgi:hypothetical protein